MYEAGVTMKNIKEMLGHDDETETTIYGILFKFHGNGQCVEI